MSAVNIAEFQARADEADRRIDALAKKVASMEAQGGSEGGGGAASDEAALEDFKNLLLPKMIEMRAVVVAEQAEAEQLKADNLKLEADNTILEHKIEHLLKRLEKTESGESGEKKKMMCGGSGSIGPAWTRGEIEAPAGVKNMGTWTATVYTAEQQARLGVDEKGEKKEGGSKKKEEPKKTEEKKEEPKKLSKKQKKAAAKAAAKAKAAGGDKKGKGGGEDAAKALAKKLKNTFKEGGKKGQDISGMSAFGQMYATTEMMEPAGDLELLKHSMAGANVEVDAEAEDRKGGAGNVGKFIFSSSATQVAMVCHVPKERTEVKILDWVNFVIKSVGGGEIVEQTDTQVCVLAVNDPDKGVFALKIRDSAINAAFQFLVNQGGLVPEDDGEEIDLSELQEQAGVSIGNSDDY